MIRSATKDDIPAMVEHIGFHLKQSPVYKDIHYNREKMANFLEANVGRKNFFCNLAIDDDKIIGGLCAGIFEFIFSREVYSTDHLFYVVESKRSLRLATELVDSYVAWAKSRGVRQIWLTSTTGIKTSKFNLFCERKGFTYLGSTFSMEM